MWRQSQDIRALTCGLGLRPRPVALGVYYPSAFGFVALALGPGLHGLDLGDILGSRRPGAWGASYMADKRAKEITQDPGSPHPFRIQHYKLTSYSL